MSKPKRAYYSGGYVNNETNFKNMLLQSLLHPSPLPIPRKSLTDCLGATSYALGSDGFNLGIEMWTSTKYLVPGASLAGTWEIGTSSTVIQVFGTVTPLAGVGDVGIKTPITDAGGLGVNVSLEYV